MSILLYYISRSITGGDNVLTIVIWWCLSVLLILTVLMVLVGTFLMLEHCFCVVHYTFKYRKKFPHIYEEYCNSRRLNRKDK
jgi:hypothetical protein